MLLKQLRQASACILFVFSSLCLSAQVGIGTTTPSSKLEVVGTGTTSASAALKVGNASSTILSVRNDGLVEVNSTSQGFLPPRMTAAQRNAISAPVAGLVIWCNNCGSTGELQVYTGASWTNLLGGTAAAAFVCGTSSVTFTYKGNSVTYGTVSGVNGSCWLDRNLGAARVATASNDQFSYGDLFQWGRAADGHQVITWSSSSVGAGGTVTSTISSSDAPEHSSFITGVAPYYDWRNPANDNLWQGANGINNPCPSGWRLPSEAELQAEVSTWGGTSTANAFASALKFSSPGFWSSNATNGDLLLEGSYGYYWTSNVSGNTAKALQFPVSAGFGNFYSQHRAYGYSVRCIKQ